jgi:hypothetical protein
LIDPSKYADLERLRSDIIDVVENRLEELDVWVYNPHVEALHFIKSKIIVFNTPHKIEHPQELVKTLPLLSYSSFFYHFIDARRREPPELDDFSSWLRGYKEEYNSLIERFKQIDPYFIPLSALQQKLVAIVTEYFLKHEA